MCKENDACSHEVVESLQFNAYLGISKKLVPKTCIMDFNKL